MIPPFPFIFSFAILFLHLSLCKSNKAGEEDLGPWDPDITSARVDGLLALSDLIEAEVVRAEDMVLVVKVLQKLSSLLMHSQMRKGAMRFATRFFLDSFFSPFFSWVLSNLFLVVCCCAKIGKTQAHWWFLSTFERHIHRF